MKTIEDIKIKKLVTVKERDENGNLVEVTVEKMVVRSPDTVTRGVRFGYFLIDMVIIFLLQMVVGFICVFAGSPEVVMDPILSRVVGALVLASYYFILEASTGASIGKLILGYTVINKYADKPGAGAILGRSFARIVPFEAFSCFSDRGWHDTWSDTYVVSTDEKNQLNKLLHNVSTSSDLLD